MKAHTIAILVLAGIAGLFVLEELTLHWAGFFGPKWRDVERENFERSKSYSHGMTADLAKYYGEWGNADEQAKKVVEAVVRDRFADFDADLVKSDELREFLKKCRGY